MAKKSKDPLQQFSQLWLFEDLFEYPEFAYKRMFGGLAIYYSGLMVAVLMEDPEQNYYKNLRFDYPIWNGFLLPTFREHHESLISDLPELLPHPVLGKWLYLPLTTEKYDEVSQIILQMIKSRDPRLGILPAIKKKNKNLKVLKISKSKTSGKSKKLKEAKKLRS